jgi:hypothetical protein
MSYENFGASRHGRCKDDGVKRIRPRGSWLKREMIRDLSEGSRLDASVVDKCLTPPTDCFLSIDPYPKIVFSFPPLVDV